MAPEKGRGMPNFTMDERNFLAFEYHRHKGTRNFKRKILEEFAQQFPSTRTPSKNIMKGILDIFVKSH